MKKIVFLLSLCIAAKLPAQELNIIPQPVKTERKEGTFQLSPKTVIVVSQGSDQHTADFLSDYLNRFYALPLKTVHSAKSNYIRIGTLASAKNSKAGGYALSVTPSGITISGEDYAGTFYGMQTLIQLLPVEPGATLAVPCAAIEDFPRFQYRGLHLDAGRHFFPVEYVKKYIDYIALHKMNYFHWHLTEDQGWRIEIKKYPLLTEVGGCRNGTIIGSNPGTGNDNIHYCGYYTQEQIKEVVKYAADRYITVIPEIELPGHSSAAIAAYPRLSCFPEEGPKKVVESWGVFNDIFCPSEYTFTFLENVLDEVIPLFPSKYIHIGGDESPKVNWRRSAFCQQLIKEKGLKDEHELQSYFIQRIEKYLNSKGKQIIGWDEILEGGLAPNATVMSWRGEAGGIAAAAQDHPVIMTPGQYVYFDHAQSRKEDSLTIGGYLPLETVYNYEPVPASLMAGKEKFILGAQANLWTEYIPNTAKLEYMLFPRLSALSEVLWSPKSAKNFAGFKQKLQTQTRRYALWKANYSKAEYDKQPASPAASGKDR